jgi:hypothetical protein
MHRSMHSCNCSHTRHIKTTLVSALRSAVSRGLTLPTEHKDAYPPLNKAQIVKLKHLSIVTLSMQQRVSTSGYYTHPKQ